MRTTSHRSTRRLWPSALGIATVACGLLQACGGGEAEPASAEVSAQPWAQPWAQAAPMPAAVSATLVADDGSVMPTVPQAEPSDPTQCAQAVGCATRDQAEQLDRALGGRVVWVDAGCCAGAAVQAAVRSAAVLQASLGLDDSAPVFVTGADAADAAGTAERLRAAGQSRVWLVAR